MLISWLRSLRSNDYVSIWWINISRGNNFKGVFNIEKQYLLMFDCTKCLEKKFSEKIDSLKREK